MLTILALLVVGGLIDRAGAGHQPGAAPLPSVPLVAAQSALSSSWFCAGATGPSGSQAAGSLVIANPTGAAQTATVNIVASTGPSPAAMSVTIAPGARATVPEVLSASGSWAAATVTLDGGGGAVEQELHGPLGFEVSPCATAASTAWYLPSGTTLRNADEYVSLYNPYPAPAIVDLSFVTDQGPEAPEDFQAITVPGGSLVPVDLATHLRRRSSIATSVSVRAGRIVAWKTEIITPPAAGTPVVGESVPAGSAALNDPAPAVGGLSSTLGSAALSQTWYWPDGVAGGGVVEQYVVYNPGSATAQLRLSLTLDQGGNESFPLTVGPQSVATVSTSQQIRIPAGIAHNATLISTNGVPVVAERSVTATSPSTRNGTGELIGAQITAREWVLAAGATTSTDEWIELQNPSTAALQASVDATGATGPVPIVGLSDLVVGAGARVAIHLTASELAAAVRGPLVVTGSGPMVVERDLYGSSTPGIALALGAPDINAK